MAGFGVFQPALGAALQFLPALGTPELDEMIHAVFPGPASIQDKRTDVSMDFYAYSEQTGQNFKFYPVPASFSATAPSPASSAGLYDSAYGSSFNVSPVVSSMSPWPQSPATFTSSFSTDEAKTKSRASSSRKSTASSSRQTTTDFANHPGMRIMTKDGRDVTNTASRGCKTKEQRDHAHLMRIIKACDSCKRKKIRCDPSHKKRTPSASQSEPKPVKKAKKATETPPPAAPDFMPEYLISSAPELSEQNSSFESTPENIDDLWDQFILSEQEPLAFVDDSVGNYYDLFNDPGFLTPNSSDSTSPSQWLAPFTPTSSGPSPPVMTEAISSDLVPPGPIYTDLLDSSLDSLTVPYLNPGVAHGTNYVDFALYSPPADFFLDEEPLPAKKTVTSDYNRRPSEPSNASYGLDAQQDVSSRSTVVASSYQYNSSPSSTSSADQRQSSISQSSLSGSVYEAVISSPVGVGVYAGDPVHDGHTSVPHTASGPRERLDSRGVYSGLGDYEVTSRLPQPPQRVPGPSSAQPSAAAIAVIQDKSPSSRASPPRCEPDHHDSETTMSPSVQTLLRTSATGSPVSGRPLSVGQQLQTMSTHATANSASTGQSTESASTGVVRQPGVGASSNAMRYCSGEASSMVTAMSKPNVSPVLGERSGAGSLLADSGLVSATALVATPPMQRLLVGEGQKVEQSTTLSPVSLFRLVVLGLVSSLLAATLQAQILGHSVDLRVFLNLVLVAGVSCASLMKHEPTLSNPTLELSSRTNSPKPVPKPVSTIDNVKTKIQVVGRSIGCFRSALCRQLVASAPRLPALALVKF